MVRDIAEKHPGYYEAVLQLRNVDDKVLKFVADELVRIKLPVAKEKMVKNGRDYFLADNNLTKRLGKALQSKFGGELTVTATLHTKKKNKELYRLTVLFRQLHLSKDDIVEYQGEKWQVNVIGKEIFLKHSESGRKTRVKYKNMRELKKT